MAPSSNDPPRTFREVGMMITGVAEDVDSVKKDVERVEKKIDKFISVIVVAILCPIIVSVVCTILITNSK
jgi:hypothetical protein